MSVARKDDRHNEDLAREIADSFNQTMRAKDRDAEDEDTNEDTDRDTEPGQRFVITGDKRQPRRRR